MCNDLAPAAPIEADPGADDDTSSNYASDVSDTTSLRSSIFAYEYENGRRYHAYRAGQYLLPNDETEQERLDMTHHVFLLTLGGSPCLTKLEDPRSILDVGTGTGIWAIEMGDLYPGATITGTDLSPIQPSWVPPNVRFEIDDAQQEWTYDANAFDFIHARTLAGAIKDWHAFLRQCHDHLEPGGRVEISEGRADFWCDDGTLGEDTSTYRWLTEFRRLSEPLGFDIAPKLVGLLEEAGFEDVELTQKVVPLGTWPKDKGLKELGRWFRVQFLEMAIEAYTLALFTRAGGWAAEEVQVLLAKVRRELKGNDIHLYTYTAFATGRKPEA
ncbi:related to TAM domain methyltransferase [Cephalotrichum gorgonifer]|uniref:Related to TAM domain methyltransferase n=1 Tax=Cephalotrichum gorgonifer TaxID=2041049 RepID=A0AAE8N6N9_9PEZI|nr:related to TAM domain methyltransferase [Cephalotrichum gorgonifer]